MPVFSLRTGVLITAVALAGLSAGAQGGKGAAPAADLVHAVRADLAHAKPDEATARIAGATAAPRVKDLGSALVAIYQGRDDDARRLLDPIVGANDRDDATLELGLLDLRQGRGQAGQQLLNRLLTPLQTMAQEDYLRLARAADAMGEIKLAEDAYRAIGPAGTGGPDVETAWGDMCLEKHKQAQAADGYQAALTKDAAWVPAYVGLARALADDAPPKADAALKKATELAPADPGVVQLEAEGALDEDDLPRALAALDRLATAKPGTLEELSLRAAIAYAKNPDGNVDAEVARAQAINPASAEPNRIVGERAAHMYRFDDAAGFAKSAIAVDDTSDRAHADLGMYSLRTGNEAVGRSELERAWDLDPYDRVTLNSLRLLDDLDKFTVVPHGDLIFKFDKKEAGVLAPYALPLADEAMKTFAATYGFAPKGPILVEVFSKHDDFAVRTLGLPGIVGALGACFGRVVTMDSPSARPPGDFNWHDVLWHELAHVYTLQLSKYRVPRWLTEGISVFEEHRKNPAWGRELTLQFAHSLEDHSNFGVKNLASGFKSPEKLSLAYFEASLVVEHLVDLGGDQALRTLLLAYADGATDTEAFSKAFGKSVDQVEVSYAAFIEKQYGALRDALKAPAQRVDAEDVPGLAARAAKEPGNFASQMTYGEALANAGQFKEARAPLERAAALVPGATGSNSAHGLLAQLAQREGDLARARQELRALLKYDHDNINAARQLAQLAAAGGEADEDLDYALRLITDLDPFDMNAHTQFGRRSLKRHDLPAAIIEFQAVLGLGAANPAEAHTDLGEAYLAAGRKDDAKREALAALEQAPTYARAQELLLAALGKLESIA